MPDLRWLAAIALIAPGWLCAQPYTPASPETVLEILPDTDPALTEDIRQLQQAVGRRPESIELRAELAERYIALARQTDDPRYNGYAQAAISLWQDDPQAPTDILLIRAQLSQRRHAFDLAKADLQQVLERDPRNPQAWLTLSVIERVTGQLANAHKACAALLTLAETLVSGTCLADIASLTGKASEALSTMDRLLRGEAAASAPHLRRWALTIRGEIAWRLGQSTLASEAFESGLELARKADQFDGYLLSAWADFMLEQGRHRAVDDRLKPYPQSDALLLRRAIAARHLQHPGAGEMADTLRRRFAASQRRGDEVHLREHARFALDVDNRPADALWLAQRNWATQKEPADAVLLLRAALAVNPSAAEPAITFVRATSLQDVRVERLLLELDEALSAA